MIHLDDIKHTKFRPKGRTFRSHSNDFAGDPKVRRLNSSPAERAASAYNHVGDDYSRYADGDAALAQSTLSACRFAHADTIVWKSLQATLDELRQSGITSARVLDAGCGPGLWSKRIADYSRSIGLHVSIVGFDISSAQLEIARHEAEKYLDCLPNGAKPAFDFREQDLSRPLPWADGYFDLVLCNYTVLNHITPHTLPSAIAELCRVSTGHLIATLRAVGSTPTVCITGMERVREYRHDAGRSNLTFTLNDGSQHALPFKIYSAQALEGLFSPHADVVDIRAIDIFVSRFAGDKNWTSSLLDGLPDRPAIVEKLKDMEESFCRLPGWIDHGTHVLVVAKAKSAKGEAHVEALDNCGEASPIASFADFLANRSQ